MISVLYIDDELGLLEVAQLFLEQSGEFDVTTMTSATEGLDSPSIQSYDVIVSDYQMPGMDGIVFLKEVRQRFGNLPFILFTGRGREEVVIDAINNGVDFYLQKGGDPTAQFAELAHKIRQAVGRRRAEEALNESERRFRELADLLPQGIYEADTNGRLSYVNRHALEMFRYTGEDIRNGINIFDTIASVNREQAARAFHLVAEEGAKPKISTEYQALRKDGSTFPVAIFSSPILHNGRLTGVRGILMDITDIKRAEEELIRKNQELNVSYENVAAAEEELRAHVEKLTLQERALEESESRLRSFIETTRESVALIDEQGKVIEWNFGSERISGIKKEDALGSYVWDLTFDMLPRENRMEERRAAIEHTIRTMIETGIPAFEEPRVIEAVRPDGRPDLHPTVYLPNQNR